MKKNLFRSMTALLMVGVLAVGFTSCSKSDTKTLDKIKDKKEVVMGTNAEFPPFEYINEDGKIDGFDAAMAEYIAKELGVKLRIENMEFNSLVAAVKSGKIDFAAAGMTVKPDRLENVDFSDPYYKASQKVIVKKDNTTIKSDADLTGKKIGVQEGTTGHSLADEIKEADTSKKTEVKSYKKGLDAVLDLKNGKIDAVIIDSNPADVFVSKNSDVKLLDKDLTSEDYAIAVRKGDSDFLKAVNDAIKKMKSSGKYDEYVKTYIEQ